MTGNKADAALSIARRFRTRPHWIDRVGYWPSRTHWCGALCVAILMGAGSLYGEPALILNRSPLHLRSGAKAEWDQFANRTPDGAGLVLQFKAHRNAQDATLFIQQDNVKLDWAVELNGRKLGNLFLMEAPLVHTLNVPAGAVNEGANIVSIFPPKENDDILIGPITLEFRQMSEALSDCRINVHVTSADGGESLPSRLTITDEAGNLAALLPTSSVRLAARPGVIYTTNGEAEFGLRPGRYVVYATRGFEYGLDRQRVVLVAGQNSQILLQLRREVDTHGLVCADTHVHTGTYAHHGDATVDERAITLAGEGIELPISTEHDCLVDLSGAADRMGVNRWFTPVIGDEVTTAKGHFNIFPVNIQARLPDKSITDWPRLMESFRATAGVRVVVLNHPRNIHNDFQPFASTNYNALTGENRRGFEFSFDAVEVANSSALQSDWMASFRDWFALLNHGYRCTAVGSSDVHDVSRYIVGQGRTYVACDDSAPGRIDIEQVCRSLKQGRALVSLGLLTSLKVDGKFEAGDLATGLGEEVRVTVTVQAPSWVTADRVQLFANGIAIRDQQLDGGRRPNGPLQEQLSWTIARPKHDVYLIALASGPGILEPYWATARPYQPSSTRWDPRVVGATNPVWLDADGDGKFTAARGYAQELRRRLGNDSRALRTALESYDAAVRAQLESLTARSLASTPR